MFKAQHFVTAAAWENSVVNCFLKKLSHSTTGTTSPTRGRKEEREGFLWHGILSWEFSKGGPQTSSSSITWELGHRLLGSLPDQLRHSEGGAQWTGISHAFQAIGMHAQVSGSLCYMMNKISQNYVLFRSLCIYFWGLNFPLCSFYCCIKKHPKIHKHKEPFIIVSPGPRNGLSRAVAMQSLLQVQTGGDEAREVLTGLRGGSSYGQQRAGSLSERSYLWPIHEASHTWCSQDSSSIAEGLASKTEHLKCRQRSRQKLPFLCPKGLLTSFSSINLFLS